MLQEDAVYSLKARLVSINIIILKKEFFSTNIEISMIYKSLNGTIDRL